VFATSPYSRDRLAEAGGLDPATIGILPIPVDLTRFRPLDDEGWFAALQRPTIAFVGRADDPRKNASLLLDSFPTVRTAFPEARLRFVGRPPLGPLPEGAVATGEVDDVANHLRDAALLVLPSRQEGFGIVAAEALACGVPVLTTPCGGPEHLVEASGGGRILAGFDPEELSVAATNLLGDPGSLAAARRRGRDYVLREHAPEGLRALLAELFAELARD
jgi:glycosyltransferase involved in cell wall biosynthesis